jgi:hypothetical protein
MKANLGSTRPFRLVLGDQLFDGVEHEGPPRFEVTICDFKLSNSASEAET